MIKEVNTLVDEKSFFELSKKISGRLWKLENFCRLWKLENEKTNLNIFAQSQPDFFELWEKKQWKMELRNLDFQIFRKWDLRILEFETLQIWNLDINKLWYGHCPNEIKSNQNTEKLEEDDKKVENKSDQEKKVDEENFQLSISEIDLLRQQLSSCWIAPAGAVIEKGMTVKISAKLQQNRRVYDNTVRIVDTNISKSNPFYGPITDSAMRTLLNPECTPLKLPKDKYNLWKNLTITFDYSIMKGL